MWLRGHLLSTQTFKDKFDPNSITFVDAVPCTISIHSSSGRTWHAELLGLHLLHATGAAHKTSHHKIVCVLCHRRHHYNTKLCMQRCSAGHQCLDANQQRKFPVGQGTHRPIFYVNRRSYSINVQSSDKNRKHSRTVKTTCLPWMSCEGWA